MRKYQEIEESDFDFSMLKIKKHNSLFKNFLSDTKPIIVLSFFWISYLCLYQTTVFYKNDNKQQEHQLLMKEDSFPSYPMKASYTIIKNDKLAKEDLKMIQDIFNYDKKSKLSHDKVIKTMQEMIRYNDIQNDILEDNKKREITSQIVSMYDLLQSNNDKKVSKEAESLINLNLIVKKSYKENNKFYERYESVKLSIKSHMIYLLEVDKVDLVETSPILLNKK